MSEHALYVLDDSTLTSMLSNQQFVSNISCFKAAATAISTAGGCSTCARARAERIRQHINDLKTCLCSLSGVQRTLLKKLLNTRQVRLTRVVNKRLVRYTF